MLSCFLYLKCGKQRNAQTGSIICRRPVSVETYTDSLVAGPSSVPAQENRGAREPPRLIHETKHVQLPRAVQRDVMVVESSPAMLTITTYDGRVLHQNSQSKSFYGDLTAATEEAQPNLLTLLFSLEPVKFARMMEDLQSTQIWKTVLRVPPLAMRNANLGDRSFIVNEGTASQNQLLPPMLHDLMVDASGLQQAQNAAAFRKLTDKISSFAPDTTKPQHQYSSRSHFTAAIASDGRLYTPFQKGPGGSALIHDSTRREEEETDPMGVAVLTNIFLNSLSQHKPCLLSGGVECGPFSTRILDTTRVAPFDSSLCSTNHWTPSPSPIKPLSLTSSGTPPHLNEKQRTSFKYTTVRTSSAAVTQGSGNSNRLARILRRSLQLDRSTTAPGFSKRLGAMLGLQSMMSSQAVPVQSRRAPSADWRPHGAKRHFAVPTMAVVPRTTCLVDFTCSGGDGAVTFPEGCMYDTPQLPDVSVANSATHDPLATSTFATLTTTTHLTVLPTSEAARPYSVPGLFLAPVIPKTSHIASSNSLNLVVVGEKVDNEMKPARADGSHVTSSDDGPHAAGTLNTSAGTMVKNMVEVVQVGSSRGAQRRLPPRKTSSCALLLRHPSIDAATMTNSLRTATAGSSRAIAFALSLTTSPIPSRDLLAPHQQQEQQEAPAAALVQSCSARQVGMAVTHTLGDSSRMDVLDKGTGQVCSRFEGGRGGGGGQSSCDTSVSAGKRLVQSRSSALLMFPKEFSITAGEDENDDKEVSLAAAAVKGTGIAGPKINAFVDFQATRVQQSDVNVDSVALQKCQPISQCPPPDSGHVELVTARRQMAADKPSLPLPPSLPPPLPLRLSPPLHPQQPLSTQHSQTLDCWHEVWATSARDPITGDDVIVLTQMDVTSKVIAERHLALVMETEHRLVEQLFPRHILKYITEQWTAPENSNSNSNGVAAGGAVEGGSWNSTANCWRPVIRDCSALATSHPEVTLLFADIKGFTPMSEQVEPQQVMALLNSLYSLYDAMLDKYGVYKVETIGDCYFVAGGLIQEDEDGMAAVRGKASSSEDPLHAEKVFMFAKAMLSAAREVRLPTTGQPVDIRIGLHTGPVVSGVVGTRMPRFCLFGDTVNTASRMESTGTPGAIHASEATFRKLLRSDQWEPTGGIEVKGKGRMQTYLCRPSEDLMRAQAACPRSPRGHRS